MSGNGIIPLMAFKDVRHFVKWIFSRSEKSNGLDLEMAANQVLFSDIVSAFTRVADDKGYHKEMSLDDYLVNHEPYPNAPAN